MNQDLITTLAMASLLAGFLSALVVALGLPWIVALGAYSLGGAVLVLGLTALTLFQAAVAHAER
jgi:hypothetical protein